MALLDEDDIGYCRSGPDNDIDIQAVYGGRMSGRKQKYLKVNPIYNDLNHIEKSTDMTGNMDSLRVVTYETFPKERLSENGRNLQNGDIAKHKVTSDTNEVQNDTECDTSMENETETRSLKEEPVYAQPMVKKVGNPEHLKAETLNVNDDSKCVINEESKENVHKNDAIDNMEKTSKGYLDKYGLLGYNKNAYELDSIYIEIEERKVDDVENSETDVAYGFKPVNETNVEENVKRKLDHVENSETDIDNGSKPINESNVNEKAENTIQSNDLKVEENGNYIHSTDLKVEENGNTIHSTDLKVEENGNTIHSTDLNVEENGNTIQSADLNDQTSLYELYESPCDSPRSSHKEIVTQVLVHSSAASEGGTYTSSKVLEDFMCQSFDSDLLPSIMSTLPNDHSDWPDLDSLARKSEDENQNCCCQGDDLEVQVESPRHIRSISDVVRRDMEVTTDVDNESKNPLKADVPEEIETSSLYKKNKKKKVKSISQNTSVNEASSSTRTLKSILTTSTGTSVCSCASDCEHARAQSSESEILELKSVKFSEDTVFNENKSGKYKKEKFKHINLRELYRGKISSDSAIAKMNPLFQSDEDGVDGGEIGGTNGSLTASEKLAVQLTLKNALKFSKGKPTSVNAPSYLEQYLILKAHGLGTDNVDVEQLPETIETPAYNRLIQRTLAKERRKICIKWSFVIIIVTIITAVATTLGVYFKTGF